MGFRLQVRNYRGLRAVDWSPSGVCALVGANGSGKTTLLDVPAMLGDAVDRGLARALEEHGGIADARNLFADASDSYGFTLSFDDFEWSIEPILSGAGFRSAERLSYASHLIASREPGADIAFFNDEPMQLRDSLALAGVMQRQAGVSVGELLESYRLYGQYDIAKLRRSGSPDSAERRLNQRGTNVFSVLRNWRDKRDDRERYNFVIDGLREIFDDFFVDIEFEKAAQVVGASIRIKRNQLHSASLAPDGWFVALLHLTAIASTVQNDVIALDEPENALHPHAIKLLLERMRTWSRKYEVTILLATHSPVIISDFDTRPEQLFVMQPDEPVQPVPVTQLKSREWLAHFTLGDLYMREEFGAPQDDAESRADHHG